MGAFIRISCVSCGSEWNCRTGCGMQHGILENVASFFPEKTRDTLIRYVEKNDCPMFDFGFRPAVCGNCTGIVSVPVLKLQDEDVSYTGVCPDCGKKVRLIKDVRKVHCPVCGRNTLETLETGRWD